MTDKKLTDVTDNKVGKITDGEIVKALEAESTPSELNCVHGEYIEACGIYCAKKHENAKYCHDCKEHSMAYYGRRAKATLDLINRLQARVEKCEKVEHFADKTIATLQAENERLQDCIDEQDIEISRLYKKIDKSKAEAYKECVEKVKEYFNKKELVCSGALVRTDYIITDKELDNFLKQLAGEDK